MAAREANIVGVAAQATRDGGLRVADDSLALLDQKLSWVREAAMDRMDEIELNMLIWRVVITDRRNSAASDVAAEFGLSVEEVLASPYFLIGSDS